ncbi:DUF4124 domain-containing protein, partial [Brevundimonas sp.]|uniref:DUF4124 domain-containing protein n=1 Tax=Brevundimonas sp. TaxID=1871086 RepID=UPI003919F9AE
MFRRKLPVFPLAAILVGWVGLAQAQSEIFVCTDADGRKVYQNTGSTNGCRRL